MGRDDHAKQNECLRSLLTSDMAMTIDHLRVDHRVTIVSDFTDATGITLHVGERGVLRGMSFDPLGSSSTSRSNRRPGGSRCAFR